MGPVLLSFLEAAVFFGYISLLVMGANKRSSRARLSVFESRLLLMSALMGGLWGILLGSRLFGHRVSLAPFWLLVFACATIWAFGLTTAVVA